MISIALFILGLIASYYIAKWQVMKNKIIHFSINSYDIGKGLSDEFPAFKLNYDGENLSCDVIVLKGGFMNCGRNDIAGFNGVRDIKLVFPEGCKVKAVIVSPSEEELLVSANTENDKDNILDFGISEVFKSDEYFKYTAIVETSKEIKELHNKLKFQHRILNTDKIRNTYIGLQRDKSKKRFSKIVIIVMAFYALLSVITASYQSIQYNVCHKGSDKEVKLHIDPFSNLYVDEGISIPFVADTLISSKELVNNYDIKPITEFEWNGPVVISKMFEVIFLIIYIILLYYLVWGRNAHIINVLRENEENK